MDRIGKKIRQLRESKLLSRQSFCGDESSLSVRQLTRLEQGKSIPSLATLSYVSERLSLPLYHLMPDFEELPLRYQELKYLILRQPVYGVAELIKQQEVYLDEVFEVYYDQLPASERLVVDYLQATVQLLLTREVSFAQTLVEEGKANLWEASYLTLNDLSCLRLLALYFYQISRNNQTLSPKDSLLFETTLVKLLEQVNFFSPANLFVYANTLFACLNYCNRIGKYSLYPKAISVLRDILHKTHDYQKKPLIDMLEWKNALFNQNDVEGAEHFYRKSHHLAEMLGIAPMVQGLAEEWEEDWQKFQNQV